MIWAANCRPGPHRAYAVAASGHGGSVGIKPQGSGPSGWGACWSFLDTLFSCFYQIQKKKLTKNTDKQWLKHINKPTTNIYLTFLNEYIEYKWNDPLCCNYIITLLWTLHHVIWVHDFYFSNFSLLLYMLANLFIHRCALLILIFINHSKSFPFFLFLFTMPFPVWKQ